MSHEKGRTVREAAVQMESKNGLINGNLKHAASLIDRAVSEGAKLIVLPELIAPFLLPFVLEKSLYILK
jgi:predicted amidohydrolase